LGKLREFVFKVLLSQSFYRRDKTPSQHRHTATCRINDNGKTAVNVFEAEKTYWKQTLENLRFATHFASRNNTHLYGYFFIIAKTKQRIGPQN
jgi:hypothetical protein